MSTASDERSIPPYIPFDMLTRFLAGLKSTAVPNRIDNTILPNTMSGTAKRQLVSALKFLELVNDEGLVDEKLRTLVTAYDNKDRWTEDGLQIFCDAYDKALPRGFDLGGATPGQLDEAFANLSSQMKAKCIRF